MWPTPAASRQAARPTDPPGPDDFRKFDGGASDGAISRGGTGCVVGPSAPSAHIWAPFVHIWAPSTPFSYNFNLKITRNRNNQPKKSHIYEIQIDPIQFRRHSRLRRRHPPLYRPLSTRPRPVYVYNRYRTISPTPLLHSEAHC